MRFFEGAVFLGIAGAAHLGVWVSTADVEGSTSSGAGGSDVQTVAAALPAQAAMVAAWDTPPETAVTPAAMPAPSAIDAPGVALPSVAPPAPPKPGEAQTALSAPQAPTLPKIDATPPNAPPKLAETRPKARSDAAPARAAEADQQPRRQQVASGSQSAGAQGQSARSAVASTTSAQARALKAQWGSRIFAKIRRSMAYPAGTRASGTARLALTIRPDGRMIQVAVQTSSGDAALDRAALNAAKRAGRFARAPKELTDPQYSFAISLTFSRN